MLLLSELVAESVRADPSLDVILDGQAFRHRYVRIVSGDDVLSNDIERVDWSADLVQVVLCDCCGTPGCADGGYARIRRVGAMLLWTAPINDAQDEWGFERYAPSELLDRHGNVLIPIEQWDREVNGLAPAGETFRAASDRDLADALRAERSEEGRVRLLALPEFRERLRRRGNEDHAEDDLQHRR